MNATDLETYAALQKPSHVFGNHAEKDSSKEEKSKEYNKTQALVSSTQGSNKGKGNSGSIPTPQQQAKTTASTDSTQATTLENTATTDNTTATTDKAYESSPDTTVANAAKQVETDNSAVQTAEKALEQAEDKVKADASAKDFDETKFTKDQTAEQTAESNLKKAEDKLTQDQGTLETDLQIQKLGEGLTKGIGYIKGLDAKLEEVDVSAMNTTLSGVTTISQQTSTISTLLSENVQNLSNLISNAQGLSDAFSTLANAQNTLKGYLDSSSATIGQLTNGSNAVVGALDKAINQVDMALADLVTTDTQKTQAVTLAATGNSTTTDAIAFLNALKTNLMAQKAAFMNVHKNIQTAVAQAQATYKPSVMNTNNYGQMYGVDAMAGYKWFFGKTKRFGFRTYGYYSYNHANLSFVGSKLGIMEGASQVNNFAYGVGFDALYNFYESKEGYNTAGLFLGFGLGGDSFIVQGESYLKSQMQICNNTAGCSASMNTSYFQMPVEFGFKSNFSKHSGIEVGFKLPLFTNQFYKERGVDRSVDVFYKRNFSIYFNYMINF
ncbi:outer membrane beta-barrel protein [Helicobacter pylori]